MTWVNCLGCGSIEQRKSYDEFVCRGCTQKVANILQRRVTETEALQYIKEKMVIGQWI